MRFTPSGIPTNSSSLGVLGYLIIVNKQVHSYQLNILTDYLCALDLNIEDTVIADIIDGKDSSVSLAFSLETFESESEQIQKDLYYVLVALSSVDIMRESIQFKTTELANRIETDKNEILRLYTLGEHFDDARKLKEQLDAAAHEEQIRVVFIGQYTAGKSTIISALTANKEIIIDSDIATSETADYSWKGVTLTDTPGLYTENPEHDARTIEMIKKSDLLVYCITSDLFNQYTLQDFERWAFTVGYAGKMFLIVNKMSKV